MRVTFIFSSALRRLSYLFIVLILTTSVNAAPSSRIVAFNTPSEEGKTILNALDSNASYIPISDSIKALLKKVVRPKRRTKILMAVSSAKAVYINLDASSEQTRQQIQNLYNICEDNEIPVMFELPDAGDGSTNSVQGDLQREILTHLLGSGIDARYVVVLAGERDLLSSEIKCFTFQGIPSPPATGPETSVDEPPEDFDEFITPELLKQIRTMLADQGYTEEEIDAQLDQARLDWPSFRASIIALVEEPVPPKKVEGEGTIAEQIEECLRDATPDLGSVSGLGGISGFGSTPGFSSGSGPGIGMPVDILGNQINHRRIQYNHRKVLNGSSIDLIWVVDLYKPISSSNFSNQYARIWSAGAGITPLGPRYGVNKMYTWIRNLPVEYRYYIEHQSGAGDTIFAYSPKGVLRDTTVRSSTGINFGVEVTKPPSLGASYSSTLTIDYQIPQWEMTATASLGNSRWDFNLNTIQNYPFRESDGDGVKSTDWTCAGYDSPFHPPENFSYPCRTTFSPSVQTVYTAGINETTTGTYRVGEHSKVRGYGAHIALWFFNLCGNVGEEHARDEGYINDHNSTISIDWGWSLSDAK